MELVKPKQFGVTWLSDKKFQARVSFEGKRHFLGNFPTEEDAAKVVRSFLAEHNIDRYTLLSDELVAELHPTLNGETLTWPYKGADYHLWWKCSNIECGCSWRAFVFQRSGPRPTGCPDCAERLKEAWNAITHEQACERFLARGYELLVPYTGSDDLLLIRHLAPDCGYVYEARYRSVVLDGSGCPACTKTGFDSSKSAYIYLLDVPAYAALKLGISNVPERRLRQHRRNFDFSVIDMWGPIDGALAQRVERSILLGWRAAGMDFVPHMRMIPGGQETVEASLVDLDALRLELAALLATPEAPFSPVDLEVTLLQREEGERFLKVWHYAQGAPKGLTLTGLRANGVLQGVAAFGVPSYPGVAKSIWSEGNPNNTVELRRLAVLDSVAANAESWFLARAMRLLPKHVEVVVAFSDPAAGHYGGCYQASNFFYLGTTSPSYHYETPDGEYVHKRVVWGTAKRRGVREIEQALSQGLVRVDDPPKHRYAYARSRRARKALAEKALPYPKPDRVACAASVAASLTGCVPSGRVEGPPEGAPQLVERNYHGKA